jgi:4-diphosphocytidyl-2-C-methyl-D-erythritol kinase
MPQPAGLLAETAPAKVNLTLRVLGRRPDGYHELESLVAFAGVGDEVMLTPGPELSLQVQGPGAPALASGPNLVQQAAEAVRTVAPSVRLGRFLLEKRLPVAAGLGGGSADAAAALRLIRAHNPELAAAVDWMAIAARIGADVPVCLVGQPAVMTGVGEQVQPVSLPAGLWLVLANPGVPLATAHVFRALAAPALAPHAVLRSPPDVPASREGLLAYLRAGANDLEAPARALCPAVGVVLEALGALPGAELVRMSGSGPTCFAIFTRKAEVDSAADRLRVRHPDWWVAAAPLLDGPGPG